MREVVCISHSTYLGKGMNATSRSLVMGKKMDSLGNLILVCQPVEEREIFDYKLIKFCLKVDLESLPVHAMGLVKYVNAHTQQENFIYNSFLLFRRKLSNVE